MLAYWGKKRKLIKILRLTETGAVAQYEPVDEPGMIFAPLIENGVKPIKPAGSADGLIVIPFECPKCKIFQMEPIIHDYNLNIENGMKVYFDGDSEWYASPWDLEKTRLWIIENYQLDKNFELEECDLDNDCMWYETNDKKDIEELGDYDEQCKGGIGDLRRGIEDKSIIERLMTFREVLKIQGYSSKPYEIATTN